MTVKELADELGVSKPTISKAITELGIFRTSKRARNSTRTPAWAVYFCCLW